MSRHSIKSAFGRRGLVILGIAAAAVAVGFAAEAGLRLAASSNTVPSATFELTGGTFADQPARVVVLRDRDGAVRERLSFGLPLNAGADFTVILHRGGKAAGLPRSREELGRLGPIGDLPVALTGTPRSVSARLGPVEIIPLSLGTEGGRKACLGFVAPLPNAPQSTLSGWYCAALGAPALEDDLVRLLDRLRPRGNAEIATSVKHPLS